jgi:hypothetical protein
MSRLLTVVYIVFCFEMGVFLVVLPWVSLWSKNFFVGEYTWVSAVAMNYFVRGAISGLGLADIWLAIYEFWRLRQHLGFTHSRPPR